MPSKELKEVTTKTGFTIKESWCRKCSTMIPAGEFYEAVDLGVVDTNGLLSVCKSCIQTLYDTFFIDTQSLEKAIHKICITLNIKFSNEACSATKAHIETLLQSGKKVNTVFGIYKQKIFSTQKSMDKSILEDNTYSDVGTIYTEKGVDVHEVPIPQEVKDFWGEDINLKPEEFKFLETQYANFKQTHRADTYAEIVLLKQICYNLLDIKTSRLANDDTIKLVKELQDLMKNLAISPNVTQANAQSKGDEAFGLWIQDIEKYEPAEWLKNDPRGDIYRDVANTDEYFQKYFVRPAKNFIIGSKDFNIAEDGIPDDDLILTTEETPDYKGINDGETEG